MAFGRIMKPTDFLSEEELERIKRTVSEAEKTTSGEIRVVIRGSLDKGVGTPREQAIHEFYRLGMQNTRDKTGVLVLLVLKERKIEVIGDSGINEKIAPQTWDNIVFIMSDGIRIGERCKTICAAVIKIGAILSYHFPRKSDDTNELLNEVIIKE